MKHIALLGSTGSVGRSTLDVVSAHPDRVDVVGLAAGRRVDLLIEQARAHRPRLVAIADARLLPELRAALEGTGIRAVGGDEGVLEVALLAEADMLVGAIVGGAGLLPVFRALEAGKDLAIANKETLVMAGALMTETARRSGARILPVDSEHNALFQCLNGERLESVRRLVLTASGGPFRDWPLERMESATVQQALAHPTWKMGPKITIDSATLMNKGLEVIEAHFLFGLPADAIDVVIHPKSVVHSLVEFEDGSILAELGTADMRIPIRYALSYPERWPGESELRLDLLGVGALEFHPPDRRRFPCLDLAYRALAGPSSARIAINAANEVAVAAFLEGRLAFGAIAGIIGGALDEDEGVEPASVEEVLDIDGRCRARAVERFGAGVANAARSLA